MTYALCVPWFSLQITDCKALALPFHVYLAGYVILILTPPRGIYSIYYVLCYYSNENTLFINKIAHSKVTS